MAPPVVCGSPGFLLGGHPRSWTMDALPAAVLYPTSRTSGRPSYCSSADDTQLTVFHMVLNPGRSTHLCVCLADIYGYLKLHMDHTELLKERHLPSTSA